jgi:putative ABC transport system substrate-binding protein
MIQRRDFITLLGGAAAAWPLAARAQQGVRVRRIGVLMLFGADDSEGQTSIAQFRQGLQELGWTEGRNVAIDVRWAAGDESRRRTYAAELVALAPDVVVAGSGGIAGVLRQASGTVPIVFAVGLDPVASGLVKSLARPGGNITGFSTIEYSVSGKLVELLKQVAPRVTRVGVIRDPSTVSGTGNVGAIQAAAASPAMDVRPVNAKDADDIERGVAAFASTPNGGLVIPASALAATHRELIIGLAARYRLPAVYGARLFATSGGLLSYGAVLADTWRRAAGYVDRILKGEKAGDLPVQQATRFDLVINLKTATTLGLTVPPTLLAIADEVIE